jgi:hypothetical protein
MDANAMLCECVCVWGGWWGGLSENVREDVKGDGGEGQILLLPLLTVVLRRESWPSAELWRLFSCCLQAHHCSQMVLWRHRR